MGKRCFHYIISLYITIAYGILMAFSILVLTVNTQPIIACSGLAMEALEQYVGCVRGWQLCICMCIYVFCMCVCMYVYLSIYLSVYLSIYLYLYIYIYIYIYMYMCVCVCVNVINISCLVLVFLLLLWASKCLPGISDFNENVFF